MTADRASDDIAFVYVACALTNVPEADRPQLQAECKAITEAVPSAGEADGWAVMAYDPITHTPPFGPRGTDLSPEEVWRIDSTQVMEEADALIAHGLRGGSSGVGIEILMAAIRGIPILYVHDDDTPVSRMLRGMPFDITVSKFASRDLDDLKQVVSNWIALKRSKLQRGPKRRAAAARLFGELHDDCTAALDTVVRDDELFAETLALSSLTERSLKEVLSNPLRLAYTPALTLLLLGEALDVPVALHLSRAVTSPPLSKDEEEALTNAADEYGWGRSHAEVLGQVARAHKAKAKADTLDKSLVARQAYGFDLTNPAEWLRLKHDWESGSLG